MDKKSNRTDLLAAGRKKLQQYRQKKEPKLKTKDAKGPGPGDGSTKSSSSADSIDKEGPPPGDGSTKSSSNADSIETVTQTEEGAQAQVSILGAMQEVDSYPHDQIPNPDTQTTVTPRGHTPPPHSDTCVSVDTLAQTFQEQLYLANVARDVFHRQLVEQQQTDLHLRESNTILAAQLARSTSDLEVAISERLGFQGLYHNQKEEAARFSNTVDELTGKLDQAVGNVSSLSLDLDQCKSQLEASLLENEELSKNLAALSEKMIVSEAALEQRAIDGGKISSDLAIRSDQLAVIEREVEDLRASLASATNERKKFEDENFILAQDKEAISGDLLHCRSRMTVLEQENSDLSKCVAVFNEECMKQKDHEEFLIQEIERLSVELILFQDNLSIQFQENGILIQDKEVLSRDLGDCRHELMALHRENSDLKSSLEVMNEDHKKQLDREESAIQEIERLSAELVVFQDKVSIQHQEYKQLEADMGEAMSRIEQLAEENLILQSSLEIYKAKISEVSSRHVLISSGGTEPMTHMKIDDTGSSEASLAKENIENVIPAIFRSTNDTSAVAIKGCLEEAENLLQQLQKATHGMHSHSVSLSRSLTLSRTATPGVSKLIKAFESKASADDPDTNSSTDHLVPSEAYSEAKDQISRLGSVFKTLYQHVEQVDALILEEKIRSQAANVSREALEVEIESLTGISNDLIVRNIELEVLCGAMNQHAHDSEAGKNQLENLFDSLKLEYAVIQSENIELSNKLTTCNSRISRLEVILNEIRRSSNGVTSTFVSEIDTLQGEMKQCVYAVDEQWKSALSKLHPALEKLDNLLGSTISYPPSEAGDSRIVDHMLFSLGSAYQVVEKLMVEVKTHERLSDSYTQLTDKLHGVDEERSLALTLLQKVSNDLVKALQVSTEHDNRGHIVNRNQHDLLDSDYYETVVSKVSNLVGDLKGLKESNKQLYSDLLNRTSEIEELNKYCLDSDTVLKLVVDVKEVLKLSDSETDLNSTPVQLLQSSVLLLMQKFKDAEEQAHSSTQECNSSSVEFEKMKDSIEQLTTLNLEHQNEMLILKESLNQAKNAFDAIQAELLEKSKELEQAEQRVSSVREKLSIAVAKGKGLVVQRDSLKHSLADMSFELEKCSQELLLKDSRHQEIEEKLKTYSEAGERMEALESELTYIRNSAAALRESFLMKDSTLQRIEELMEHLELPDHFHSKGIVEKVDWLAKSVAGNSFLHADWDQRSSVGGGSYSDAGLVTDGGKEDVQPTLNPVDHLRRQYDELQTKFYELAEQNDMLEQSLMERNVLVQRWEEVLDRINTPPQIRSMEPEERIHWLGTALSEADHHMRTLQQKIEKLENYCESLSSDLEESQRRISELQSTLEAIVQERDSALSEADEHVKSYQQKIYSLENYSQSLLSQVEESEKRMSEFESSLQSILHDRDLLTSNFVALTSDHELALHIIAQYEHDIDRLRKDADMLRGSLVEKLANDNYIQHVESDLVRLQGLILEVLQDSGAEDDSSDVSNVQRLESLIRKLTTHNRDLDFQGHASDNLGRDSTLDASASREVEVESVHVPVETVSDVDESKLRSTVLERENVTGLRTELAEALEEVTRLREENDEYSKKNQLIAIDFETLEKKKDALQELLNQEEQKSASLREKLNLAVRKGKSLIQQRDSLKQNVEQVMSEIETLKSEISLRDSSLLKSDQKIRDLLIQIETQNVFEAENVSLKNRLIEVEQHLQHNGQTLSMLLNKLGDIDTGGEINALDPLIKLEGIGKMYSELRAHAASFEQDARKSKKAAELLVAELNEVQERNDGLQEELGRAYDEISTRSRERDLADSAKVEALSHLAKLADERKLQRDEIEKLKSNIREVKKVFFDLSIVADDAFAKDVELLNHVKTQVRTCLQHIGGDVAAADEYGGLISVNKRFKDFWSRSSVRNSDQLDDNVEFDHFDDFKAADQHLKQLTEAVGVFKERVNSHSMSLRTEADQFNNAVTTMMGEVDSLRNSLELTKSQKIGLESIMEERDMEGAVLRKSLSYLYEACSSSITEIKNRKAQLGGQSLVAGDLRVNLPSLPSFEGGNFNGSDFSSFEECVKSLADILVRDINDFASIEIEDRESRGKEMRSAMLDMQKELQEKDIQRERICMELVGQIKEAESAATNYSKELQSAKNYTKDLENKLEALGQERNLLEQRILELQQGYVSSIELGEKVKAMTAMVAAKDQEIEALMQALDEEENQMESLRSKAKELENTVQQKKLELEHVEAYRAKAVKKLSVTVSKFDELHQMSEGLLSEIEDLQLQLQDRDSEISFLRQEVTKCTNDVLEAAKTSKDRSYDDVNDFLTWLDTSLSSVLMRDSYGGGDISKHFAECKENLQKDITSIVSELEESRLAAQNNDALLQAERNQVEALSQRKASLELLLNEKELQSTSLQVAGTYGGGTSEIVEIEPVVNKWTAPVTLSTSQVRSWRKGNTDQVAIAIDTGAGSSGRFEDEDDDKVHGFKSLTTSRFVPKFTRPVSDVIDGLWVSCDRALMRQPAFRLAIMFYWALLHALLASAIV